MKKTEALFQCHYCNKKYHQEGAFIRHRCKAMERSEKLQTPLGQAAWQYYQDWMRLQRKRVPDDRAFLKSRFYVSFNRFAEFVKRLELPSPKTFVKLMVEENYPPTMWTRDEVYAIYMEYLDRIVSPRELADITVDTLLKLADEADCDVSEVFNHMNPSHMIELIRQRKLSPWILLPSKKFGKYYVETRQKNHEQGIVLESIIRPTYWSKQFNQKPNDVKYMKKIIAGLEL